MGDDVVDVGLAVVTGGLSLAITEPMKQQKQIAKDQRKQAKIQRASQKAQDIESRRKLARQERVRRAQIEQTAQNLGSSGSSGEVGALSALSTNVAVEQSKSFSQAYAADAITDLQGNISKAQRKINLYNTITNLALQGANLVV